MKIKHNLIRPEKILNTMVIQVITKIKVLNQIFKVLSVVK